MKINNKMKAFKTGKSVRQFLWGSMKTPQTNDINNAVYSSVLTFKNAIMAHYYPTRKLDGTIIDPYKYLPIHIYNNRTGAIWTLLWQATLAYNRGIHYNNGFGTGFMIPPTSYLCDYVKSYI